MKSTLVTVETGAARAGSNKEEVSLGPCVKTGRMWCSLASVHRGKASPQRSVEMEIGNVVIKEGCG